MEELVFTDAAEIATEAGAPTTEFKFVFVLSR
jgi:hypothetical protein